MKSCWSIFGLWASRPKRLTTPTRPISYAGFQIRKRGQKEVLLEKLKMYEYKPRSEQPPRLLYMKNAISLKGLPPGDYDLTLILRDEIAKGPAAKQVVKFRIIPASDSGKQEKASPPDDKPALR